jgi:putative hydrolase of the HAD superfamily
VALPAKHDIDAVIFDFAGVLSTSPTPVMMSRAAEHGIDAAQFVPIVLGPLDADTPDHPWHRLERGQITLEEFAVMIEPQWRAIGLSSFPLPPQGSELLDFLQPVPEMIEAARALRAAGLATAILTNNIREWSGWRQAWDADRLVDVVVDSSEVGLRKPNPAIFDLTIERLGGVGFDRVLFLDDFPWNVAAAAALGINAVLVTDPVATAAELHAAYGR